MEEMQILNDPLTTKNEALRVLACTAAGQEIRESANLTGAGWENEVTKIFFGNGYQKFGNGYQSLVTVTKIF